MEAKIFSESNPRYALSCMPKEGKVSTRYAFESRKAGRTFRRGESVEWRGERWRVQDAVTAGSLTECELYLLSPDGTRCAVGVDPLDVR